MTEPPTTEPIQTEPTVTEPPTTEPIQTEPTVTEPPATEPAQTEPTVTVYYVPEGCTYIMADGTQLQSGEAMPTSCADGDEFVTEAYTYKYGYEFGDNIYGERWFADADFEGWGVGTNSQSLTEYPQLLSEINGKPLVNMRGTFVYCEQMTTAPAIPAGVTNMAMTFMGCMRLTEAPEIPEGVTTLADTFMGCSALQTAPEIPSSVTNMKGTFSRCQSLQIAPEIPVGVTNMNGTFLSCSALTAAPAIPYSVSDMSQTFRFCTALTGEIMIDASPADYSGCLSGTVNPITLTGSCTLLAELAATAESGNVSID